jgi:hypothetical protein
MSPAFRQNQAIRFWRNFVARSRDFVKRLPALGRAWGLHVVQKPRAGSGKRALPGLFVSFDWPCKKWMNSMRDGIKGRHIYRLERRAAVGRIPGFLYGVVAPYRKTTLNIIGALAGVFMP